MFMKDTTLLGSHNLWCILQNKKKIGKDSNWVELDLHLFVKVPLKIRYKTPNIMQTPMGCP